MPGKRRNREPEEQGQMTVEEAGHKGGETVKEKYGPEFYSEIGKKGGKKGGETVQEEARRYQELKEQGKIK